MNLKLTATEQDYRIAQLAALAIGIHVLESAFPSPMPGIKPGLANVITLTVYFLYGWRAAAWVSALRVIGGSLILGTFMTPTFMLSLSGALATLLVMGVITLMVRHLGATHHLGMSPVGVAVLAAMGHILGQFLVAWSVFIPHPALLGLLPVLMTAAVFFGLLNGMLGHRLVQGLQNTHDTAVKL